MEDPDLAVALSCDPGRAPACPGFAKDRGALAAQIALAHDRAAAIRRDQGLAARLITLEVDCSIPVAAVAETLGHLYRADRELQDVRR